MLLREISNEEILALPLDRLSYLVLQDLAGQWNWRNWIMGVLSSRSLSDSTDQANAFAEALQWLFSRGLITWYPAQGQSSESVRISRLGERAIAEGLGFIAVVERLSVELSPALEAKVRSQFLLGDFEIAAFAAMKEVEIAVRARAKDLDPKWIGVDLMRQAFKPGGPLADDQAPTAEQEAQMALYAGAIGLFKNPASHKRVDYNDPTEASEIILLADLLLRMLPADEASTES